MHTQFIQDTPKLVGIDLETTGSSWSDRIIEFAIIEIQNGTIKERIIERVNPGIPIPQESTEIHGITDEDIKNCPPFSHYAEIILSKIKKAVLFGYNIVFDFNVLSNELKRLGHKPLNPSNFNLVDPFSIWKKKDPKTLSHAYEFFCGKSLEGAHNAMNDIEATYNVLLAQFEKYDDLPQTPIELGEYCYPKDPSWLGSTYHFVWNKNNQVICNFGKMKGTSLEELLRSQRFYLEWILKRDFPEDLKAIISNALSTGQLPKRS